MRANRKIIPVTDNGELNYYYLCYLCVKIKKGKLMQLTKKNFTKVSMKWLTQAHGYTVQYLAALHISAFTAC